MKVVLVKVNAPYGTYLMVPAEHLHIFGQVSLVSEEGYGDSRKFKYKPGSIDLEVLDSMNMKFEVPEPQVPSEQLVVATPEAAVTADVNTGTTVVATEEKKADTTDDDIPF